jgi:hypothetical protein
MHSIERHSCDEGYVYGRVEIAQTAKISETKGISNDPEGNVRRKEMIIWSVCDTTQARCFLLKG